MFDTEDTLSALQLRRDPRSVRDHAAAHLTRLILSGRLAPGEYLPPEEEVTRQLGVSRTAYREAISRLEALGLLEVRHGIGTRVADRSREAVATSLALLLQRRQSGMADLLEVRRLLEMETAALAAQRASDEDLAALEAAVATMRDPKVSMEEYISGDLQFHLALAAATHNAVLWALVESLRSVLHDAIAATYGVDGRTERRLRHHEGILEAVRRRDPAAAREAMALHLQDTEAMLRRAGCLPASGRTDSAGSAYRARLPREPGGEP
jgi:GntR family transcriptional repressor for pyruvate dehydrogenase complex